MIRQRFGDDWFPTDLYLEGSDQHRGWFQTSLLPALGVTGQAPFKTVLTHGFMVDKDGKKMSKSEGNTLEVDDLFKEFGADVCRWWVSSLNTDNDIKVDHGYFKLAGEEYRKVRNTLRFVLGNLEDFDPAQHRYAFGKSDVHSLDAWAMGKLFELVTTVREAYETFQYRKAHEAIFNFCNDSMSAIYLAATKDRLYCDKADSPRRRRTQTAMFDIANALVRLVAPILPHTADEAWAALHKQNIAEVESVHLQLLPAPPTVKLDPDFPGLMQMRDKWLKALEETRQQQQIDNPLDLGLRVSASLPYLSRFDAADLADLCGISRFERVEGGSAIEVVDLRGEARCERSWKRDGTVKQRSDGGMLCERCAAALAMT